MNTIEVPHYSIVIQWSDEDQVFVVSLPEWGPFVHTHGDTYDEALKNAQEVLDLMIESATEDGETLPEPQLLYTWTRTCTLAQQTGSPYGDGLVAATRWFRERRGQWVQ